MRRTTLALVTLLSVGCGHSEEEWQAQLAKYEELAQRNNKTEADLEAAKARILALEKQLADLGVKLDATGTEKESLSKDLEQMRAALDEYKARAATLERIKQRFEALQQKLGKLTSLGLKVNIRHNQMVISLPGDVLFDSGQDSLRTDGKKILSQVAEVIRGDSSLASRHYQVAGHTDNQKLKRTADKFIDNWGLSVMRARQVLVYLIEPTTSKEGGGGLDPKLWAAAGYGATDPLVGNQTPEGRAKNRRVELVFMPDVEEMLDLKTLLEKTPSG